jgi:tRNA A58 N-methylase Trm61
MKYAVEVGSGIMIYTPSITKIGSSIQKLIGEYTCSIEMIQAYFRFFLQNKESRLKYMFIPLATIMVWFT